MSASQLPRDAVPPEAPGSAAALLRATLDATADGILVVSPGHEILLRNRQFLRMWNIPPQLAHAQSGELLPFIRKQLKDPEQSIRQLEALFRSPDAEGFALIECADGRVLERYTSVMQLADGASARVLSFRDITARVAAETEAREAREAAETANRAKSDFLDNVSHEIRTPLNGVLGITRLLLAEGLTPRQRRYVELADASASSLLELIEDLLDLGKIESGRMELEATPFRLDELLDELHDMYGLRAQEKGLRFTLELDAQVPLAVRGDSGRLRQVLNNLLSNALKFTAQGEFGLIVGRSRGGRMLRFTVYDSGIGIPFEAQQRLFTRFAQADRATSRRYGGTGLGLAIVKQLADMMGGSLLLQSEPGRGTSVRCELPLPEVPPREVPRRVPPITQPAPAPRHATRVLVAEDNETNQVVIRGLLAQAGYHEVTVVADGEEALAAMAANAFDLVLMDCRMPRLDGYEAARRLRAQGFTQPIIALTANAAAGERERCLAFGMSDYLAKPIDAARLAQVLAEWTAQHAAATAAPSQAAPAAAPAAAEGAVFERARALDRLGGDEDLLRLALAAFRGNAPQVLQAARAALAARERPDLRRHLHSLAGSASMVGGASLHRLAKALEADAEAGAFDAVEGGLRRLDDLLRRFLEESAAP
jgi:signal transduction histidine kinase/AmiR/NasT family two-component response regulator